MIVAFADQCPVELSTPADIQASAAQSASPSLRHSSARTSSGPVESNALPSSTWRDVSMQDPSPPDLLSVVPDGVFGPLASPNRRHYCRLLCRLFGEFFGPDAPLPPSAGLPRREITAGLEHYLLTDDPWEDAEGESPDTPVPVRAAGIYERLRTAGWLRQERIGAREMVSMPPVVVRLMATLVEFSERGPAFLGAKVRSIELQLQLQQVVDGQAGGDTLDEAAILLFPLGISSVATIPKLRNVS